MLIVPRVETVAKKILQGDVDHALYIELCSGLIFCAISFKMIGEWQAWAVAEYINDECRRTYVKYYYM